jgi:hypothetical protein
MDSRSNKVDWNNIETVKKEFFDEYQWAEILVNQTN